MDDRVYNINDTFMKGLLFKTDYVLELLDFKKSEIIAFYR